MKKKILTLIMLILLFIVSVSSLIVLSINAFAKDEIINDIEYPIWLESSFYEDKENPIKDNITEYNKTNKDLKGISFVMDWFGIDLLDSDIYNSKSEYLYIDESIYNEENENVFIGTTPETYSSKIDETLLIGLDQSINLNNVTSINNSIIGSKELTFNNLEETDDTLIIENSIIYSLSNGNHSLLDSLSKYEKVEINNSIIFSVGYRPKENIGSLNNSLNNIWISNSIISGEYRVDEVEDKIIYSKENANEIETFYDMNIVENVCLDDFLTIIEKPKISM